MSIFLIIIEIIAMVFVDSAVAFIDPFFRFFHIQTNERFSVTSWKKSGNNWLQFIIHLFESNSADYIRIRHFSAL